ncbi:response regulator [Candidatus Methylomicrobium oryzae]|jgi:two-component system OmpR family response regulator|uniref:response regulator n=1 Tax=Candidatus Methylomicrobium oryzae TaxID=2802053 RepID=UPI001921A50E|nr:response regulator [Methylomicrobium sp. RS1]MBL1265327.1 response regulator [Methylomicrobium sp. RS1]
MSVPRLNTILYVEDEADIGAVAKLALEAVGGFSVTLCRSGEEAIERASAFTPDLILLDVMMPGLDGPSTLKALRAIPPLAGIPVIFMTAKVQPQEIAQFKTLGVVEVIAKPFDPMSLADTVLDLWNRYHE